MNHSFDFRDSSVWDDRKVDGSVGDCLPSHKALGWSMAIVTAIAICLVVL
jgi:hypothetical protein